MTICDSRALAITAGSEEAVNAYEQALTCFLNYEATAGGLAKTAVAQHPEVSMASILRGYMTMMIESTAIHSRVAGLADSLLDDPDRLNNREYLHASALHHWACGDMGSAAAAWDRILANSPLDILALKMHHYTTFWRGRPSTLRGTIESVRPFWDEAIAGYDHFLGMRAFALNETGQYEEAESVGRDAVDRNPEDLWSVHAVAHTLESQGHIERGIVWFQDKLGSWESKNPFQGHLWWHAILFPYSAGNYEEVLRLYDERLEPLSSDFFLDIQNRASILQRLELAGVNVDTRWDQLGEFSANRLGDHVLPFTDLHCCLALAAMDPSKLGQFVDSMIDHLHQLDASGYESDGYQTATKLARGIERWANGDATTAATELWPLRYQLAPIGGSHAQQSLFIQLIARITADGAHPNLAASLLVSQHATSANHYPTITSLRPLLTAIEEGPSPRHSVLRSSLNSHQAALDELDTNYHLAP